MKAVRDAIAAGRLPVDPDMPATADVIDHNQRIDHDLRVLEHGLWSLGRYEARLAQFAGEPNAEGTSHRFGRESLARMRSMIDAERKLREMSWPARCRYTAANGLMTWQGTRLRRGDVVALNRAQLEAFRDRFERVEESETVTD